ncbi:hypothetical protein QN224_28905 [Sinorhizobium sp. 8-89]|uniref:hypothetical protein n=1 Tax=Sinorhizobium sp. 7-81 TaxID=3049087 RepID=UPI0024C3A56C|nr:hypothetical protein [Sinorhizobium sp. 7-81]MDK1389415.1 hypothetical protein [Sinorhizobium sp. 7-81]
MAHVARIGEQSDALGTDAVIPDDDAACERAENGFDVCVVLELDGLLLDMERLQAETGPEILREFRYDLAQDFFYRLAGLDHSKATRLINIQSCADALHVLGLSPGDALAAASRLPSV